MAAALLFKLRLRHAGVLGQIVRTWRELRGAVATARGLDGNDVHTPNVLSELWDLPRIGQETVNQIGNFLCGRIQREMTAINSMHLRLRDIAAERFRF